MEFTPGQAVSQECFKSELVNITTEWFSGRHLDRSNPYMAILIFFSDVFATFM